MKSLSLCISGVVVSSVLLVLQAPSLSHSSATARNFSTSWEAILYSLKYHSSYRSKYYRPIRTYHAVRPQKVSVTHAHHSHSTHTRTAQHAHVHAALLEPEVDLSVFDQKDIEERHKHIAKNAMRALPKRCQSTLKNFHVRYEKTKHRGLAGKTTMILSGRVPDEEFRSLFLHEIGHVFDLNLDPGCLGGTPEAGKSKYTKGKDIVYKDDPSIHFYSISWDTPTKKKAGTKKTDFVSGYAGWDMYEDFAESHVYFVLHNEEFRQRAINNPALAAKYRWFQTFLYTNGIDVAESQHTWKNVIPWDITKLPYEWKNS